MLHCGIAAREYDQRDVSSYALPFSPRRELPACYVVVAAPCEQYLPSGIRYAVVLSEAMIEGSNKVLQLRA